MGSKVYNAPLFVRRRVTQASIRSHGCGFHTLREHVLEEHGGLQAVQQLQGGA